MDWSGMSDGVEGGPVGTSVQESLWCRTNLLRSGDDLSYWVETELKSTATLLAGGRGRVLHAELLTVRS
jgi:hypothetical protein